MNDKRRDKALGWMLSFSIGFLSLSQEILWIRFVGFLLQNKPQVFAATLGIFLFGIALGAVVGKRCSKLPSVRGAAAGILLVAGLIDLTAPAALIGVTGGTWTPWAAPAVAYLILITAALKASLFPIAHQLASDAGGAQLGRSISRVYFLNILGSTLGPVVTGFWLLDRFNVDVLMMAVGLAMLLLALVTAWVGATRRVPGTAVALAVLAGASVYAAGPMQAADHRLLKSVVAHPVSMVVENRQGIIHIEPDERGDIILGGNVYDGRINTSLVKNSNGIDRVYLLGGLHPKPSRVLVIGLSGGSWTRVLSWMPDVEKMDVVEINPGYLEIIRAYPEVSPLLQDPRVDIHIDDGRRWLRRHPQEKYDLIVMNTTYHWRAYITNLLSQEFMGLVRGHLAPGGILAFNSTGSPDVLRTASSVFPHAYRWSNFVYAAEHDFRQEMPRVPERLLRMDAAQGDRLFAAAGDKAAVEAMLQRLAGHPFVTVEEERQLAKRELGIITDDNMLTEFAYGFTFTLRR